MKWCLFFQVGKDEIPHNEPQWVNQRKPEDTEEFTVGSSLWRIYEGLHEGNILLMTFKLFCIVLDHLSES